MVFLFVLFVEIIVSSIKKKYKVRESTLVVIRQAYVGVEANRPSVCGAS